MHFLLITIYFPTYVSESNVTMMATLDAETYVGK
jgi:hypothetical protein